MVDPTESSQHTAENDAPELVPIAPDCGVPCTCGLHVVRPYPNDTGYHSTTECIDQASGRVIPPAKGDAS